VEWDIWVEGDTLKRGEIIGVVKDFHYQGMKQVIEPLVFHIYPPQYSALAIKLTLENLPAAIESVEAVLRTWNNDLPVDFHFLDEDFERFYQTETEFSTISQLFTVLAVVVACLGLLGLSIFITNQQLKSVSIRKVFGATAFQIFILLNSFYFRLSLVAAIIGLPLSYIFAQRWLSNYAYKINLGLGPVSFVLLIMLVISVMTISFQAARASVLNPTTILRNE
jgi:putative ABC transport system permease protein